ncbi:Ig-like domain-containing protein [Tritonibacter mobilis]|uniref:Ig-like domain-containing protein n=7 Tax=Tritonibacter mobilis TaxID=379347 RepID=UPI000A495647|nr:Ig-like domain-containing protein [Tritonibacter mobilis]
MATLMTIAAAVWGRLESLPRRFVTKVAVCSALAVIFLHGLTQSVLALDARVEAYRTMPGGQCYTRVQQDSDGASVFFRTPSSIVVAGGSVFSHSGGAILSRSPITAAWLEANCGFTNVTGLVQDGANGTVATDDQMFVRFTADVPGIGRYDFDHGLYGVTGTVVKRDVVLTDPVPTVTLSGLSSTFINPQIVTATFSETVSGFDATDIQVTNATISSFVGSGATYTFKVTPNGPGAVTVLVPADAAVDSVSFPNLVSNTLSGTAEGVSSITAAFNANPGFGVSVPHTVFFTDQSSSTPPALKKWNWDFGDGGTSTSQNPIHTYTSFGTYTATLETCVYTTCDTESVTIEVVDVPATMTPSLSGFSGNVVGAQTVTVEFNAGVDTSDALQLSDFDATNLTLSNLSSGSPTPAYGQTQTYTLTATPDGDGAISLTLPASAVSNYRSVANTASNTLSGFVDTTAPTITLVDAGASTTPYVGYSAVLEYSPGTIFVLGYSATLPGTVALMGKSILPGNQMRYTIVPQRDGPVYVTFPAGMFRDVAGNFSAETRLDLGYADVDEPRPEITGVPALVGGEFEATITFSKTVEGFTGSDIQISGGTLSSLSGSGANYTARITPDGSASITVSVPADAAQHVAVAGVPGVFSVAAAPVSTVYNTAPVANAGPDQVVQSGTQITLDGSASSDPNGDALAYQWSAPTGITLSDATAVQPNFTAPSPAPGGSDQLLSFTLTVDDGTDTHQDTVDVTVMAQVAATLAGLPSNITGPETITVDFSSDVTGFDETDLQLQNLSISNFASTSPSSYQFNVAPLARGSVSITLPAGVAQDSRGNANVAASLTATGFTNTAPLADAGADQAVGGGVLITLDGSGSSDADGDSLTYLWTPPAGIVLSDVTAEQPSFTTPTPAPGDPDQVLSFTLTVDDGTETHQDIVDVTVMAQVAATLAGLPSNITGSETITVDFSGDVTGFDETDLQLQNLALSAFVKHSPSSYQFDVAPLARGSVSITLPAGVAQDSRGNTNVAASLTATGFINTAPLADAGADQVAGGGVLITLDGSGSSDPDGDGLTYLWTAPAGITLSDATSVQPSFTTPTLSLGDPDLVLDFTLTVDDGTETHSDQIRITLRTDVSVTLAGLTDSFSGPGQHQIDIQFSRAVSGLTASDLVISGGEVQSLSGSGARYQALLLASGRGDLSVSLPAGVTHDNNGIPNAASNQMTAVNRIIEQTSQLIAGFMQARANNLISNQPRVADFLLGRSSDNQLNASVTRGQVNMDMAVSPRGGAWASLRAAFSESDGQDSGYALAAVGRHIEVQPNLLLGAMLQMDYAESTEGPAEVEGYGWLVGPYAVYRLPDQPVIFSAQILYGQSQNEIAPLGTYRDQFKTERWLAQLGVTGEVISGDWTIFPFLTATHTRDDQRAYIDHLGNMIPVQGIRLTNVELGGDFELQLTHQAGERVLTGGVSGIWSETSGSGAAALREPTYEGGRMRLELGYGGVLTNGGRFQFSAYGDGFGANDYSSYGIEASYSFAF